MSDGDTSSGCGVTVLRTVEGARATKEWRWHPQLQQWQKISYQAGAFFIPREHQVANLAELVEVLDDVRRDPCAFVVRGALTPATAEAVANNPMHRIRRRKHQKNGVEPTLVEVPRWWFMIDIDGWPLRASDDLAVDPESAIDNAIYEILPEAFYDADIWWQLSSSAGFVPGILKVHLFGWLTAPATNAHIKAVLEQHAPGVDRAPFSAAQPHFVADPIIQGGHDPLPRRTGWRKGLERAVELPALVARATRPRPTGTGATGRAGGIDDALAFLGHGEAGQGFHAPLRAATLRYARQCHRMGNRDDEAIKDALRDAIRVAPCRPGGDVEHPYCEDNYLQSLIDGAFALMAGDAEIQTMRPHHAPAVHTLEDARKALEQHVGGFFDRALTWNDLDETEQANQSPEHAALVVGVGTGKSTAARRALPEFIAAAKAMGKPHRVLWLVPTHKLGSETLEEMQQLGINAVIMRGRDAVAPGQANMEGDDRGEPQRMCLNLEAVEDAISICAAVETSVCGSAKKDSPCCPWRAGNDQCAFQRQKGPVARADVVIAAHQSMFYELSREVRAGLAAVIVDESWWQAGLIPHREVNLDSFAQEPLTYPVLERQRVVGARKAWRMISNDIATNDLHSFSAKAQEAFAATDDGDLISKATVEATGLTAKECASAYALEWRRMFEGAIYPGQPLKDRRKAMALAAGNAGISRRAAVWRALQALLDGDAPQTGRLQTGSRTTKEGSFRTIVLHSKLEVRDEVAGLPILCLDATMPLHIVRYYLPRIELLAEIQPVAPHMEVRQVIGGWGKTSLVPSDRTAPDENRRRVGLAKELSDFAALNSGGDALVITYQAIEAEFQRPGIRTGHFNAIAGLDGFRDVRSLFVIGRPLPDARELRDAALALTGRAIPEESGQVETRGALMDDGSGSAMNVRAYRDPDLEALRVAVTEAEIIQAIGRGRGVNRTADRPLTVFLLADVATPLPITNMARWSDIRLGVLARMASRGAVLLGATDASRVYPDLFPTADAARMAIQRSAREGGDFPNIPLSIVPLGDCSGNRLVEVTYRPEGRGQQSRRAWVAESRLDGLKAWLEEVLATTVNVQVVPPSTDPDPPSTPCPDPGCQPVHEAPESRHDPPPVPVCDVPWLHPEVAAFAAPDGQVFVRCPHCGQQHRHGGFGHRMAHCDRPDGRGYVLVPPVVAEGAAVSSGAWS